MKILFKIILMLNLCEFLIKSPSSMLKFQNSKYKWILATIEYGFEDEYFYLTFGLFSWVAKSLWLK